MNLDDGLRWAGAHRFAVDGLIAAVLSVMAQVQVGSGTPVGTRVLLLAVTVAVAWRRRAPLLTCLAIGVLVAAMALTENPPSVFGEYFAVMLAAYTVAERRPLAVAAAGGAALAAGIVVHDLASTDYGSVSGVVSDIVVPFLVWGLGRIVYFQNTRAERSEGLVQQLEADREELARAAVAAERRHLARELHDVVTHSISVAVIQAQGAQRALDPDQPEVRQALQDIERASRTALTEMRRLLGLLREDADADGSTRDPLPGLADLPALVEQVAKAGLAVELSSRAVRPDLDPGVELSVYRIVQEALTNAIRYAPGSRVVVTITEDVGMIAVCVTDDGTGTGTGTAASHGSGRGLLGMRERVTFYGGTLDAGPVPGSGFRVHARLPIRSGLP